LAADALAAAVDPLLRVVGAETLQLGQLAPRLEQVVLRLAELARGLAFGLQGHFHDRSQTVGAAIHGRRASGMMRQPQPALQDSTASSSWALSSRLWLAFRPWRRNWRITGKR